MGKKALVVATVVRFLNFERNDIKLLQEMGYEVHCATNLIDEKEKTKSIEMVRHQIDFTRSPLSIGNVKAYFQLRKLMKKEKFDLVHCHTPAAGVIARLCANKYRRKGMLKVIYTAHGFHFFKGAPIKNWILFYPIEWFCSFMTDVLITINKEDYDRAKKNFKINKIIKIPGVGIELAKFVSDENLCKSKRQELNLRKEDKVILSVGEINTNKNHQLIIKSLASIGDDKIHYFIAGKGNQLEKNILLAKKLGIKKQVHFLGYRNDIPELNAMADIFAFPSIREGLGLAAIEALASGNPVVGMDTRGINEYVINGITGYRFKNSVEDCAVAIDKAFKLISKSKAQVARECMEVAKQYDSKNTMDIMKTVYEGK